MAQHDLVICTKDRPDDLARALASVQRQTSLPDTCWVIDASEGGATQAVCERFRSEGLAVEWTASPAGTGLQRNMGVRLSNADIVHFTDDDVDLAVTYFEAILEAFGRHPKALGIGGLPTNLPSFRPGRLRRLIAPASTRQGAVLRSGRGVLVYDSEGDLPVDWLSGCCMSFRRRELLREPLDEVLTGYALGEDLDVSYRIRQHGPLFVTPQAKLLHLESPTNRLAPEEWMRRDVLNRHRRAGARTGRMAPTWFWIDSILQVAAYAGRAAFGDRGARQAATGLTKGLYQAARTPTGRR